MPGFFKNRFYCVLCENLYQKYSSGMWYFQECLYNQNKLYKSIALQQPNLYRDLYTYTVLIMCFSHQL